MSTRRIVRVGGAADVGHLVELRGMLFSSTITAGDPETGHLSPEPADQARSAFGNLNRLLTAAGTSPAEIGLVRIAVGAADLEQALDSEWLALFPTGDRPARRVDLYPLPDGQLLQLQIVGVRGARRHPVAGVGGVSPVEPAAVRIGNLVFSSSISGIDPSSGCLAEDRRDQLRQAFQNVDALVHQVGGTTDDVAHVFIYVRDRADNDDVLASFLEAFPEDGNRSARKNVFDDQLASTSTVAQLQMIAVVGQGRRQNYEVPGAAKRHPNPLGTRLGSLLFSAGIGGHDPEGKEVARQADRALHNVRDLMEEAGGTLDDVAHITFTVDDYAHVPIIDAAWRRSFPDPADEPARHVMAFGGRDGNYQIQVHVVAALNS